MNALQNGVEIMSEADRKILDRLHDCEQREDQFPGLTQFYRELLQIQSEAKSRTIVAKPDLAEDLVDGRLRGGIPLLLFKDFSPDWHQVKTVFEQVVVWAAKDSEDPLGESERLINIGRKRSLLRKVARAWYQGHSLKDIALGEGVDDGLLTSVIAATLKPFLFAYSKLLLPEVDQELWRRRYCPICGGKPDFAYLDKEKGARWLLCPHCDTEWLFLRLECPYCGTQDQDNLAYFTDGEESYLYRLYVCEQCRTYIKAIDLRHAESEVFWPLERMLTLDMDRQAQEQGYKCGWTNLVT